MKIKNKHGQDWRRCRYCGSPVKYKVHLGRGYWYCVDESGCGARVGCHRGTVNPLGTLAREDLRKWRIFVHDLVDPLWREDELRKKLSIHAGNPNIAAGGYLARSAVYALLGEWLKVSHEEAHISRLDIPQLRIVAREAISLRAEFGDPRMADIKYPYESEEGRRYEIS